MILSQTHLSVSLLERRLLEGNPIKETQENDASLKKELAKTLGTASGSSEMRIGGRKMGLISKEDGEMASKSSTGDEQKLNVEEDKNVSKEGPQDFLINQGQENALENMPINSSSSPKQGISRLCASHSSFKANMQQLVSVHDDDQSRKLLIEADKKVMTQMMRRDYGGMKRPRRRPPINNHQPQN